MDLQILDKSFIENSNNVFPPELYNSSCNNENDIVNGNIDSYMLGFKNSTNELVKKLWEIHLTQLKNAVNITYSEVIPKLTNDFGIKCVNFYINAEKDKYFEFLISIDNKDFSSNKKKEAYKFFINFKRELKEKEFNLDYSFVPFSKDINEDALLSDGYNFIFQL